MPAEQSPHRHDRPIGVAALKALLRKKRTDPPGATRLPPKPPAIAVGRVAKNYLFATPA